MGFGDTEGARADAEESGEMGLAGAELFAHGLGIAWF